MKSFLIQLAVRFLLRRLAPDDVLEKLKLLIESAEHQPKDGTEKFHFVKEAALKSSGGRVSESHINAAIELAVLARKLTKK